LINFSKKSLVDWYGKRHGLFDELALKLVDERVDKDSCSTAAQSVGCEYLTGMSLSETLSH
jgi:hypothetical protein